MVEAVVAVRMVLAQVLQVVLAVGVLVELVTPTELLVQPILAVGAEALVMIITQAALAVPALSS
jgi:hypothetical protein